MYCDGDTVGKGSSCLKHLMYRAGRFRSSWSPAVCSMEELHPQCAPREARAEASSRAGPRQAQHQAHGSWSREALGRQGPGTPGV